MNFRPLHGAQETLRNIQDDMGRLMERIWHAGLVAGPFDGFAITRRRSDDEPRLLHLEDEPLGWLVRRILGARLPGDLLIRIELAELIPHRGDEEEHHAAKQEVDEGDELNLSVQLFFTTRR